MTGIHVKAPTLSLAVGNKPLAQQKRVALPVLGCKVNSFESELIAEKLTEKNYIRVSPNEIADLYVINTCTVTAEAARQTRQIIRKIIRQNIQAKVVVTGCYAQMAPEECLAIPGVDMVVGNSQKLSIPSLLTQLEQQQSPTLHMRDIDQEISLPDQLVHGFSGKTRAFVQIQQGCDQGCTFCIIHKVRGPNKSFSAEMIKRQCERLIINGYKELVLCGVDIGSYGDDMNASFNLPKLLQMLLTIEGDFRLRLSSIDPIHISDEFIDVFASNEKICPQLHLSLQSANTLILKRMKRRASRELIYQRIAALRSKRQELVLSADLLVGFPTETDEQFADTLNAVEELSIAYPHVFTYSARDGTPAARIPKQVASQAKKERSTMVRQLGAVVWHRVAQRQIGQKYRILIEQSATRDDGKIIGRADNYFSVMVDPDRQDIVENQWLDIEVVDFSAPHLIAKIIDA